MNGPQNRSIPTSTSYSDHIWTMLCGFLPNEKKTIDSFVPVYVDAMEVVVTTLVGALVACTEQERTSAPVTVITDMLNYTAPVHQQGARRACRAAVEFFYFGSFYLILRNKSCQKFF
jgi:hypothetical protein